MKRGFLTLMFAATVGGVGLLGGAPASADCTVSVPVVANCSGGNCAVNTGTCRGSCTVNAGYCGTWCRAIVNAGTCW